ALGFEERARFHRDLAGASVDTLDDVLIDRRRRPQELTGAAIERIHDARFTGNTGDDLALLTGLDRRIDPLHRILRGRDLRLEKDTLEGVVEIPMIDDVLVEPHDLARLRVNRERAVVIQVF